MRFYIENFGCQMNEHDMEKMASLLLDKGYEPTSGPAEADVVIVNTCCVREKAEQKFYSFMGRLRVMKRKRKVLLGVTGCIAQMEKEGITERLPFIDFSLGPASIHRIGEAVDHAARRHKFLDFADNGCRDTLFWNKGATNGAIKSYITIMKGCNNFCSYCIVPYVRGRETSRESGAVLEEIREAAAKGVKEVTLLGQNVNSYNRGNEDISFPSLLAEIDGIDGIERIRFVTSHPKDLSHELIDCFGRLGKLCEHIHLPFQSGSDKVLRLMNRGYTAGEYSEKIRLLRDRCPDMALTADCIVGFPGEDEKDFEATMELVRDIGFDGTFSFVYSPRKGTRAADLPGGVPRDEGLKRLAELQALQKKITINRNKALEGKRVEVLVEDVSKNSSEEIMGRTRTNKIVNFKGDAELIGSLATVRITRGYANSLKGEIPETEGGAT